MSLAYRTVPHFRASLHYMRNFARIVLALAAFGSCRLGAQTRADLDLLPPTITQGEKPATTKLTDRMAALHVPGVSIAVIHNGKLEWAKGYGVVSVGGAPVTPETLFQAASISKPVSAMAVMHLVQTGKLNLDIDVNQYLKSWKIPTNDFTQKTKITLRELLSHTGGMTVHGFPGYAFDAPLPTLVQILNGAKPANSPAIYVDIVPGSAWRYSGGGFVVIQQLLLDVTGKPFPTFMKETVLGPAGMAHSTYEQPLPKSRLDEAAMPYHSNGQPTPGGRHVYPEMSAAGLWTTPSDLAHFAIELQNALAGNSSVLSAATAKEMLTPIKGDWGLGIGVGGGAAHPYFQHGGANDGFQCDMVAYNSGDGVAIMTNSDNGGQLASEILRTIAYERRWPDFAPRELPNPANISLSLETLQRYAGVYGMAPGINMMITLENGQLVSQMTHQQKLPLTALSTNIFTPKVVDAQLEFPKDEQGASSQLVLHQNGRDMTAKRLSDAEAKAVLDAVAGFDRRFKEQKPAAGSEAAVRRMVEGLITGKPDYDLMSPSLANATRQQLTGSQSMFAGFGALQSITFKGVGPGGADIYQVKFEKASIDYRIWLTPAGKVDSANFRPSE
jgi:CubicO group peptidase (beta-lactamase class C family)